MSKPIEVVLYDTSWPEKFEAEAVNIRQALGDNCVAVHHIGSTAVPGLAAKPKVDIVAVIKRGADSIEALEKAGFVYKGEWNIPFKYGFTKRDGTSVNLHVFEEEHPEIELNLLFRDYLRSNPSALEEYASMKEKLLSEDASHVKQEGQAFSGYNLGKDAFIRKILNLAGFEGLRFLRCTHYEEWEAYHRIRKEQLFDPRNRVYDRNHPCLTAADHFHFVLLKGTKVVAVAMVEFLNETEAALRGLATDEPYKGKGYARIIIGLLEKWLRQKGKAILKLHSCLRAEGFYRKLGYTEMPFPDRVIFDDVIDLGKRL
jgi:GrpB-like predicted nucleotidyltransferase (UPF0157 family)/GNAT superfamily N-acetyltransferase